MIYILQNIIVVLSVNATSTITLKTSTFLLTNQVFLIVNMIFTDLLDDDLLHLRIAVKCLNATLNNIFTSK